MAFPWARMSALLPAALRIASQSRCDYWSRRGRATRKAVRSSTARSGGGQGYGVTACNGRYKRLGLERNLFLAYLEGKVRCPSVGNVDIEKVFLTSSKPVSSHLCTRAELLPQHDVEERMNEIADMR